MMILILDKLDFNIRNITKNKEEYFIMVMGSIFQEDKILLNLYVFINKASKFEAKLENTEV